MWVELTKIWVETAKKSQTDWLPKRLGTIVANFKNIDLIPMETVGGVAHTRNCKLTDGRPGVQYKVIRAFGRIKRMPATLVHLFCNTLK